MAFVMVPPDAGPVRRRFQAQRRRDTRPEMALRRELHRRGLRYRVDVAPAGTRNRADIVFPRQRVAVFVDGCFWHGCARCRSLPKTNTGWWREKFRRTVERDQRVDHTLSAAGWTPLRVWEHEAADTAADRVQALLRQVLATSRGGARALETPS